MAACLPAFGKEVKVARISLCPSLRWDPTTPSQRSDQALAMGASREDPPICSISPLGPVPEDSILGRALSIKPRTPTLTHGARRRGCSAPSRGQVVGRLCVCLSSLSLSLSNYIYTSPCHKARLTLAFVTDAQPHSHWFKSGHKTEFHLTWRSADKRHHGWNRSKFHENLGQLRER